MHVLALHLNLEYRFIFSKCKSSLFIIYWQVIEAQVDMPVVGAITLYVSLLTFTLRVHPDRLDYVDQVLVCLQIY